MRKQLEFVYRPSGQAVDEDLAKEAQKRAVQFLVKLAMAKSGGGDKRI